MADFSIASKITGINEGGLSNDVNDHGHLTYCGIASAYWPNWAGWPIVKQAMESDTVASLKNNIALNQLVQAFYKGNFWNVNKLDLINDQQVANNVYDFGVNSGVTHAAKTLQTCVGVTADGIVGPQTLAAVNNASAETVYDQYNEQRRNFYERLAQNPGQAQFLNSWLSRLKPYQT